MEQLNADITQAKVARFSSRLTDAEDEMVKAHMKQAGLPVRLPKGVLWGSQPRAYYIDGTRRYWRRVIHADPKVLEKNPISVLFVPRTPQNYLLIYDGHHRYRGSTLPEVPTRVSDIRMVARTIGRPESQLLEMAEECRQAAIDDFAGLLREDQKPRLLATSVNTVEDVARIYTSRAVVLATPVFSPDVRQDYRIQEAT